MVPTSCVSGKEGAGVRVVGIGDDDAPHIYLARPGLRRRLSGPWIACPGPISVPLAAGRSFAVHARESMGRGSAPFPTTNHDHVFVGQLV